MENPHSLEGIHHITAITASAAANLAFYTEVLGLRLVKKTVNFDDPYTYHLYYADALGTPGTVLTFFPWEHLAPGRPGPGMVTAVAFAVARDALDSWWHRLRSHHLQVQAAERFGDPVLQFEDPDGLRLELIGVAEPIESRVWDRGPVPVAEAIMGFHSATQLTRSIEPTRSLLVQTMDWVEEDREGGRHRYHLSNGRRPGRTYDLLVDPDAAGGRQGAGSVHHIAFRTPHEESQLAWQGLLRRQGLAVTPVRDRSYFRSIYFHEPGGVLFEIATEGPGFTLDEAPEQLGRELKLPPRYEQLREAIALKLPPLQ